MFAASDASPAYVAKYVATTLTIDLIHVQYSCTVQEIDPGDRR